MNHNPLSFSALPSDQQHAFLTIRGMTTYLWPKLENLCQKGGERVACAIRFKTYDNIEPSLLVLSKIGYFSFWAENAGMDNNPTVLHLHVNNINESFKDVVLSMTKNVDPQNFHPKTLQQERPRTWSSMLPRFLQFNRAT